MPTVSAGRRHLRRARRHGHGRRHPLQQEGLRRPRPLGAHDLGGVRGQQRQDQGRRHRARRRRPTATPGPRSCSCSPTTTTCRRPCPTSPTQYTDNKVKYADHAGGAGGLPAPPGGLRQGLVAAGLRLRHVRRRPEDARRRRDRPVPDAHASRSATIATNHPDTLKDIGFFAQPGTTRPPTGATIWMPAGTYIPKTTEAKGADTSTPPRSSSPSSPRPRARTRSQPRSAPAGPYVDQGRHAARRRAPGASPTSRPTSTPARPRRRSSSCRRVKGPSLEQITVAVGSGLHVRSGRRRPVRPGRQEAGQAARPARLVIVDLTLAPGRGLGVGRIRPTPVQS